MAEAGDLFGHPAPPAQLSLFGEAGPVGAEPAPTYVPDPEHIRQRLAGLLSTAREARAMPWCERDARLWRTVFPQMADWLPKAEADQLRAEFGRELERLAGAGP